MKYYVNEHHNFWQWPLGENSVIDSDVLFMWADWPFEEQVNLSRILSQKVVTYEHGFGALWDYELNGRRPISDGYLALGQKSKESLMRVGVPEERILVTGNPVFDDIKKTKHTGNKALFVALHWVNDVSEYNQDMYDKLVAAYPQFDWTAKVIDKSGELRAQKVWYNEVESVDILSDIKKRLPEYDMVFTLRPSTFSLFARIMGIPTYCIDENRTYEQEGEPVLMPMNYTYLKIGDPLPKQKPVRLSEYLQRPSVPIKDILKWIKKL